MCDGLCCVVLCFVVVVVLLCCGVTRCGVVCYLCGVVFWWCCVGCVFAVHCIVLSRTIVLCLYWCVLS